MQEKNELKVPDNNHHQTWIDAGLEGSRKDYFRQMKLIEHLIYLSLGKQRLKQSLKSLGLA